jgi:hypothetical protein
MYISAKRPKTQPKTLCLSGSTTIDELREIFRVRRPHAQYRDVSTGVTGLPWLHLDYLNPIPTGEGGNYACHVYRLSRTYM